MKTYQILNENDILQKGDEYLCSLVPLAWASTTRVGEKALTMHRRLVSGCSDYIQKLEKDLSFYKEATDAAIADIHFYRQVIDKLTKDVQEL